MNKIKLGILAGGNSIEKDISILSCKNILENIDKEKYNTKVYSVDANSTKWLEEIMADRPDVVLSALHGGRGENGSMQGLLHYLAIPFVGTRVLGSSLCMDKKIAKTVMEAAHIPTARDIYIERTENISTYKDSLERLGYPLIIKPNRGGSSIGIKICHSFDEIYDGAVEIINGYDDDILIEKYIEGRELSCLVTQGKKWNDAVIMGINRKGDIFAYEDKYQKKGSDSLEDMPPYQKDMIRSIAFKAFKALKCRGYAMIDMIVKAEQIYVIEVNTLPGLTATSLVPEACKEMGISFGEYLDMLISYELS